jgi:tetratricopeptide (TPR) repeat protein
MLRAFIVSAVLLAIAGSALADDLEACRDRQAEAKLRLAACENLIMAGQLTGKDLAIALAVRGNALMTRRDTDKAIAAYSAAHDADPAAPQAASYRCITYAAMARFGRAVVRHNRLGNAREQVGKIDHQRSWSGLV